MDEKREKYIGFSTRYSEITGRLGTGPVIFYAFGIQRISGTLLAIRYLAFEVVSSTNQLNTLLGRLIIF